MDKRVCPILSSGGKIYNCHDKCVFLDDDNECKLNNFFDNIDKLAKNISFTESEGQ